MLVRTTLALLALASPALAGGFTPVVVAPAPAAPAIVAPPAPSADWSGLYLGAQVGTARGEVEPDDPDLATPGLQIDLSGGFAGLHVGYMRDLGRVVLGGELDYDAADAEILARSDLFPQVTIGTLASVARAKLRLGFDAGRVLPYLTAGIARASFDWEGEGAQYYDDSANGRFVGVGAAVRASDRLMVEVEALRHDFPDTPHSDIDSGSFSTTVDTISLRASWRF